MCKVWSTESIFCRIISQVSSPLLHSLKIHAYFSVLFEKYQEHLLSYCSFTSSALEYVHRCMLQQVVKLAICYAAFWEYSTSMDMHAENYGNDFVTETWFTACVFNWVNCHDACLMQQALAVFGNK